MQKQKRQKYSNGATVKKEFKDVGSIEGKFKATQNYQSADIKGSVRLPKGLTANAYIFKDSAGNKNDGLSVEKKLGTSSSVRLNKNRNSKGVSVTKGNLSLDVTKPKRGDLRYGLTYRKKI
jgi:hypothetical protein